MKTGCYSRMEIEAFKPPSDSVLISIRDPGSDYPKIGRMIQGWRFISFHDFWDVGNPNSSHNTGYPAATEEDLIAIKDTIDTFWGHNIFVHCEAGISRSSAVREFLIRRKYDYFDVAQKNRMVHPNAYILAELERMDRYAREGMLDPC